MSSLLSDALREEVKGSGEDREYVSPPIEIKEIRRRVTWADGTAEAPSAHLAVSIPRHKTNKVSFSLFLSSSCFY